MLCVNFVLIKLKKLKYKKNGEELSKIMCEEYLVPENTLMLVLYNIVQSMIREPILTWNQTRAFEDITSWN